MDIEKTNTDQIQDLLGKSSPETPNSPKAIPNSNVDASLQVDYASFIDKATQIPQTDTEIVQKAQELLSSGQLETPENIRAAAENIADFGI
jgi:hypothetical protein